MNTGPTEGVKLDNIIYLESSSGIPEQEVLVSKSTEELYQPNQPTTMNTETNNNRPLIITMIIIGIIIIVLLASPRYRYANNQAYSYRDSLTATVVPINSTSYNTSKNLPGSYTRTIIYTETPKTTETTYTTYPTTTYTTYPTTTETQYTYPQQYGVQYDANGCSPYANYSVTTGWPCR